MNKAVHDLIKKNFTEHQRVIFNGDGYSDEWVEEAKRRGLPNIQSTIEAASALSTEKAIKMYEKFHIFTKAELLSREEITYDTYAKAINIEALTMIDMAGKEIIPAVCKYESSLAKTVNNLKEAGAKAMVEGKLLEKVEGLLEEAYTAYEELKDVVNKGNKMAAGKEKAFYYKDVVRRTMDELRQPCDELEQVVDKELWPIPTYGELMFEV